jgi:hypothetical protein
MIQPDEEINITLTGQALQVIFGVLQESGPYKVVSPVIELLRHQVLAHDPTAFDQPPRINGVPTEQAPH